jgi:hypothetical protein
VVNHLRKYFLFFSERYEKEHSTVLAVFEEAMAVGFSTPASYLEVPEVSKMHFFAQVKLKIAKSGNMTPIFVSSNSIWLSQNADIDADFKFVVVVKRKCS